MLLIFSNTDHAPLAAMVTALSAYLTAFDMNVISCCSSVPLAATVGAGRVRNLGINCWPVLQVFRKLLRSEDFTSLEHRRKPIGVEPVRAEWRKSAAGRVLPPPKRSPVTEEAVRKASGPAGRRLLISMRVPQL